MPISATNGSAWVLHARRSLCFAIALMGCQKGPPPEQVRLELPSLVTTSDPARALVRARYPQRGSVVSPSPHDFRVHPPDVASITPDGDIVCRKTGDARVEVDVQGVKNEATLRCRLVDRLEFAEIPPLDVSRGPVSVTPRALAKDGKEVPDVPVVLSAERPTVVRVSGLMLTPLAVGETGIVARAGNAERRLRTRVVRTLDVEALPLDGGRRIHMSMPAGKYEWSMELPSDRTVSVEWRGAPYCAYRATGKNHRSGCTLHGKGGVVFDNPAFLESGATEASTQGVVLAEVP